MQSIIILNYFLVPGIGANSIFDSKSGPPLVQYGREEQFDFQLRPWNTIPGRPARGSLASSSNIEVEISAGSPPQANRIIRAVSPRPGYGTVNIRPLVSEQQRSSRQAANGSSRSQASSQSLSQSARSVNNYNCHTSPEMNRPIEQRAHQQAFGGASSHSDAAQNPGAESMFRGSNIPVPPLNRSRSEPFYSGMMIGQPRVDRFRFRRPRLVVGARSPSPIEGRVHGGNDHIRQSSGQNSQDTFRQNSASMSGLAVEPTRTQFPARLVSDERRNLNGHSMERHE